ncbi:MAG: DinB family protein [Gemmatimonadales bacterium]
MPDALLEPLLDTWTRNNLILRNLLFAIPDDALDLRPAPDSPTIRGLFAHMHYCRLVFVEENAPELAVPVPTGEWRSTATAADLAAMLDESAAVLARAVRGRLGTGRPMDRHYDHPILMLQHFVWHEGYHHGQIKLTLKLAGRPFDDEAIGPLTWDVWMDKAGQERPGRA